MWIVVGIAVFLVVVAVFTLAMCKAAGDADRRIEGWRREREERAALDG